MTIGLPVLVLEKNWSEAGLAADLIAGVAGGNAAVMNLREGGSSPLVGEALGGGQRSSVRRAAC